MGARRPTWRRGVAAAGLAAAVTLLIPPGSTLGARFEAADVLGSQVPDVGIRPVARPPAVVEASVTFKARPAISIAPMVLGVGASGSEVMDIQKRLAALHYDVGATDGTFGYDTAHAVTAFQKINGLSRTGIADSATKAALEHPVVPSPRYGGAAHIEVDLSSQVVLYVSGGSVQRIMDTSTGGGDTFVLDGVDHYAITPLGSFSMDYVIPGWWESPVGAMYSSWFFLPTFALHGSSTVPPFPDSHGCVRLTLSSMDRLYSSLYVGMMIHIYA